jgi:hypothetical protein
MVHILLRAVKNVKIHFLLHIYICQVHPSSCTMTFLVNSKNIH